MKIRRFNKAGMILVAIGCLIALIAVLTVHLIDDDTRSLVRSAVVLDEPVLLPENEGKIVIVRGKLAADAQVQEPIFGFSFDSPVVECVTQSYNSHREAALHGTGKVKWGWDFDSSQIHTSPARIGELEVDEELVALLPTSVAVRREDLRGEDFEQFYVLEGDGALSFHRLISEI